MASRCCGNRLSLRNQYDTKTPRASLYSLWPWEAIGLLAACLDLHSRLTRVTNPMHSVRFDILRKSSKISREENLPEKFLRSARPPDSVLRTPGRVIVNVTSARTRRKPSASTGSSPALGAAAAPRRSGSVFNYRVYQAVGDSPPYSIYGDNTVACSANTWSSMRYSILKCFYSVADITKSNANSILNAANGSFNPW